MRPSHHTLTANEVYRYAANLLQPHLQWQDHGPKCLVATLLKMLFYAAGQLCSLFAACGRLRETPSDQAVRNALTALCPQTQTLERRLNASFAAQLPKAVKGRRWRLAIDLNLRPYYGQAHHRTEEVYRSQAQRGTTHFHAYATCYLVHRGRRYTVALTAVAQGTPLVAVIKRLLHDARRAGVRPSLLVLDRGFYSVAVIRYLQAARYPFVMPVVRKGRRPTHPDGPTGTWVFATWQCSGWSRYTLTSTDHRTATVNIAVQCRNWQGHRGRHGRQRLIYAFWGIQPKTTQWIVQAYRQRFGIETSYRQLSEACIKTTTRNPTLRLLFVGIALFLRNVWIQLHWHYLATPRRGGRQLNLHKLRFKTLLMWLTHLAEDTFGIDDTVVAERGP